MDVQVEVIPSDEVSTELYRSIVELCNTAYRENLWSLFATFGEATHVCGWSDSKIVTHAMWVTRWLQPGSQPPLKTAYVEMVATLPSYQGRGLAARVMRRLVREIPRSYDLAALCPAQTTLYRRLGWQFWRGPLHIRAPEADLSTPEETVMIFQLPGRSTLDPTQSLSAEWREGELW